MKIGIIKEGKIPVDHRVPFTPEQCKQIKAQFPEVEIVVQPSDVRAFSDQEYLDQGIQLQEDLNDCDWLFGVKEVPMDWLIADKTYFFFSHTIKKQPYNRELLKTILSKNIQLVDYECLKNAAGQRVVAFGRWAGIVGAYNAFRTYGLKYKAFDLKPANQCLDRKEMWGEFSKIQLPAVKICLTGGGRVSQGAMEVLDGVRIKKVSPEAYLSEQFEEAVYTQLDSEHYNTHREGKAFDYPHFYQNPTEYDSAFAKYLPETDVLIAGAYWDPKAPVLFTKEDVKKKSFKIRVIADITCDIEGSIPTTIKPTTIADPFFDYCVHTFLEKEPFSSEKHLTVMSVDNLPCELPRDASQSFGEQLIENVLADFLTSGQSPVIDGAMITSGKKLTSNFEYLSDYIAD